MDWISLPVSCGKEILSRWLVLDDIAKLDVACCSQAVRSTFREWCDDTTLMMEYDIDSRYVSTTLLWLLERRLNLDRIEVLVGGSGDIEALHRYLLARGGVTRDICIFFNYRLQPSELALQAIKALLRDLPRTCPRVTEFQLSNLADDECLAILAPFMPQLTSYYCSYCLRVTSAGLVALAKHFCNLRELTLEEVEVGDEVLLAIAESCPGLQQLSLGDDRCTNEGYLAALPKLRALRGVTIDFQCSTELAQMICQHPSIVSVNLHGFTVDVLKALFQDNAKLQNLSLSTGDRGITESIFVHVKALHVLGFTGKCSLAMEMAKTIAGNNPNLNHLSIETSGSFAHGFVATILSNCSQLEYLTLLRGSYWEWSDMGRTLDAALLKAYPQLRHVRVDTRN